MRKVGVFVETTGLGDTIFDKLKEILDRNDLTKFVDLYKFDNTVNNKEVVDEFKKITRQ